MGATGGVVLVDWAAIQDQWRVKPGAFRCDASWDEETDDFRPPRFQAEYRKPADWVDSWRRSIQAGEYYDKLRRDLSKPDRARRDRLVAVFFQMIRKPTAYDLSGFEPDEGIANIISPTSLAQLVDEIKQVDIERMRSPFEARCRPDRDYWLKDFDEFRDHIRQWLAAVDAAHQSGRAMVLWVA